jgi:hypothetical protein
MKPQGKYASVSFVHAQDAGAFYDYVRRHGLYISQKRVRDWELYLSASDPWRLTWSLG